MHSVVTMVDTPKRNEELTQPPAREDAFDVQTELPSQSVEQLPRTEQPEALPQQEVQTNKQEGFLDETIDTIKTKLRKPKRQKATKMPQVRDELTVKVEKIMEEGLVDAFKELSPIERQEFKMKGEEVALQIRELLKSTHVKIKKIFKLLFGWLRLLPGINRFYLEQEAKIKADKIVSIHESSRHSE